MNILMMTNTFTPHVGGVARSVEGYTEAFRRLGHRVLVAAPLFKGTPEDEHGVVRFPAVRDFNGSDFSLPVPKPFGLLSGLQAFRPQVVHAHHPFLLGGTALRIASARSLPLVFTHHTLYDQYTHYVPGDSQALKRFAIDLVTGYCNLCDAVIAPSRAVRRLLETRGVRAPIAVIPTGIETRLFAGGDGPGFRRRFGIPERAFVVGHVGRLAPEKNLGFLTEAVARFLEARPDAYFLLVGAGPAAPDIRAHLEEAGLGARLVATGVLGQPALAAAYRAMDVFAFASRTETQGMVLGEAMAAGVPVVALLATGAEELVADGQNGRLLRREDGERYAQALAWIADQEPAARRALGEAARRAARAYEIAGLAQQTLDLYRELQAGVPRRHRDATPFAGTARRLRGEWRLLYNIAKAAGDSLRPNAVWEIGPAGEDAAPIRKPDAETGVETPVEVVGEIPGDALRPRLKARVLGWIWSLCLRLQCATWRKRSEGLERLDSVLRDGKPVLFCFWHGKYVPLFALLRGRPACVFTTRSARGEVIAEVCRRFGYACVQVPARSQGQAFELMRRALTRHANGGIAVDGPLGPYHRVKRGAIKLASELGYLVIPASASARRKRVFRHRWDRLELPGLFTQVGLAVGEPVEIPPAIGSEAAQAMAQSLRKALEALDKRAEQLAGIRGAAESPGRAMRAAGRRAPSAADRPV